LNGDVDVLNFIEDINGFDLVNVYVENSTNNFIIKEEIIDLEKWNETDFDIEMESGDKIINGVEVEF